MTRLVELCQEPRCEFAENTEHNYVRGLILLVETAKPRSVLEIGCHKGVSTEVFMILCNRVVAVDIWDEYYILEQFKRRSENYSNVEIVRARSPAALDRFADNEFDMVYIDGEHNYDSVVDDIKAALRIVKPFGWIAGHDVGSGGVGRAVLELLGQPIVFPDTSWLIAKPA